MGVKGLHLSRQRLGTSEVKLRTKLKGSLNKWVNINVESGLLEAQNAHFFRCAT